MNKRTLVSLGLIGILFMGIGTVNISYVLKKNPTVIDTGKKK